MFGVERIERITPRDEAETWTGRAVAEGAAEGFAAELAPCKKICRQIRIGQSHAPEADEIGEAVPHVVLSHVWEPLLQIAVRRADEHEVGACRLEPSRRVDLPHDASKRIFRRIVAVDWREERRPL